MRFFAMQRSDGHANVEKGRKTGPREMRGHGEDINKCVAVKWLHSFARREGQAGYKKAGVVNCHAESPEASIAW